jgi:hypothetical protein
MAQLAQRFGFYLADALAGYLEALAHFFQGVLGAVFNGLPPFREERRGWRPRHIGRGSVGCRRFFGGQKWTAKPLSERNIRVMCHLAVQFLHVATISL